MTNLRPVLSSLLLLAVASSSGAQQSRKPTVGWMTPHFPPCKSTVPMPDSNSLSPYEKAFLDGLHEHGYVAGSNIIVDRRCIQTAEDASRAITEFVNRAVDVIVLTSNGFALAAKEATRTIPIVCAACADPVVAGVATTLARPEANVTGLANLTESLVAKRIELLKEALPRLARLTVLVNPNSPATPGTLMVAIRAGQALGVKVDSFEFRNVGDLENAFRSGVTAGAEAVLLQDDPVSLSAPALTRIGELSAKHRIATAIGIPVPVDGVLLAYGPDRIAMSRRAAAFADKILKGAAPRDLPFEQPTKIDLVVNLRTAHGLGLTIAPSLLLRANQVLE